MEGKRREEGECGKREERKRDKKRVGRGGRRGGREKREERRKERQRKGDERGEGREGNKEEEGRGPRVRDEYPYHECCMSYGAALLLVNAS